MRAQLDGALVGCELPEQEPQERCLSCAVGADDAHLVAAEDVGGEVREDRPSVVAEGEVVDRADEIAAASRLLNHELRLAHLIPSLAAFVSHRLERPHAAFVARAAGLDALANPDLFLGQPLVEERVLFLLGGERVGLSREKRVVVARPVEEPAAVDLPDPRRQLPQKRPVVRDKHERARPHHQKFLKPADGSEIKVIGRLVEEQEGGLRDQLTGQQCPPLQSGRHLPNFGGGVDLHPVERAGGPFVSLPAFDLVGRHGGVEGLPHEGQRLAREVQRHFLGEVGDAGAWSHHAASLIGLLLPGDHLQERGLAGAVAAEKADPLASLDLPGDAVEERRPAIGDRQVVEVNKRHARAMRDQRNGGGQTPRILPKMGRTHRTHRPRTFLTHFAYRLTNAARLSEALPANVNHGG